MKLRNRTAAFLAIPALTLALAACSDNEDTTVVTDAPAETKVSEAISGDGDDATTTTDGDATTIAGLVIHMAQSIPTQGQVFSFQGYRFEIITRRENRITRLKIRPLGEAVAAPGSESAASGQ